MTESLREWAAALSDAELGEMLDKLVINVDAYPDAERSQLIHEAVLRLHEASVDDALDTKAAMAHHTRVVADNAASVKPDYVWRDPSGIGWIDAWNGWYETLEQALADTAGTAARGEPWVLAYGQRLITEAERDNADPERNAT